MAAPQDCAGIEPWQALVDATMAPEQRALVEEHLESCAACQARLDQSVESQDPLLSLARRDGDPTMAPADPTLDEVLERLHTVKSPLRPDLDEPVELYFLRPTDQPGILGTLGSYLVCEVIGQGGMGVVLKAHDPALQRLVAIKVMAAAVAGSATARRRFTREAQAAAAVCHDHIVAVHGVQEADGLPYIVMQYIAGESLQARLDRVGPLELMDIVRIGLQAASGLAAAHAHGLIHRDIKPANLLLENGLARVKITDFGLARMTDDVQLTQSGGVAGTPEYMAPEQARGESVDHRADLFSLGSVLYTMCTGVPPFRGASAVAVLRQVSDQSPPQVRMLNPDIPVWLESLVGRLMANDRARRFQSASEVAELLEAYLAHLRQPRTFPMPKLPTVESPADVREQRFPRLLWLSAAVLVTVMGLGIGWRVATGDREKPSNPGPARTHNPTNLKDEFHQDLRDLPNTFSFLQDVGQVSREKEGVRITLPAGHGKLPNAGLTTDGAIQGDFEITLALEILHADKPTAGYGVGASIWAALDPQTGDAVSLARRLLTDGSTCFMSDRMIPVAGKLNHKVRQVSANSATCRLRIQRVGSRVRFLAAEGDNPLFVQIDEQEFDTADVHFLQVGGHAGGSDAGLDLRLLDLTVRAEGLPEWPVTSSEKVASAMRSFLNVTLGREMVPDVAESGFHYQEFDRFGQPFRWTNGNARLSIPIDKEAKPESLACRIDVYRGGQRQNARLQIVANGHLLFVGTIALVPTRWEKTLNLDGIDLGDHLVVEILSDTFNPLDNPAVVGNKPSDDQRTLGVQVRSIKLLAPIRKG